MSRNILVVAAHPDDETLGMGGTIAHHTAQGDSVFLCFIGNGVGSRDTLDPLEVKRRTDAAQRAADILGAKIVAIHDFPDNEFDTVSLLEIIKAVEQAKNQVTPDLVYTHHGGDLNIDHRICCQAVLTAFRPQPQEPCREIRTFEVKSSTEWSAPSVTKAFQPDTYIDISKELELLREACECYAEEMRPLPHTRSVEAVITAAQHRGYEVGLRAAETFMTLRRVIT